MGFQLKSLLVSSEQKRQQCGQYDAPILVVDEISKSRGVHNGQAQSYAILLNVWREIPIRQSGVDGKKRRDSVPAVILSIVTVLPRSVRGSGTAFLE